MPLVPERCSLLFQRETITDIDKKSRRNPATSRNTKSASSASPSPRQSCSPHSDRQAAQTCRCLWCPSDALFYFSGKPSPTSTKNLEEIQPPRVALNRLCKLHRHPGCPIRRIRVAKQHKHIDALIAGDLIFSFSSQGPTLNRLGQLHRHPGNRVRRIRIAKQYKHVDAFGARALLCSTSKGNHHKHRQKI
jgi:hypothetical protein